MSKKLVVGLPLILSVALFASPPSAGAAGLIQPRIIVGNGTPASCTETALQDALTTARLSGGGLIKFRCGADPVTIVLSVESWLETNYVILSVPNNTTIDGEAMVTLTGALQEFSIPYPASVIFVDPTATVILKNLSLEISNFHYSRPFWNAGTLTLQNVTAYCRVWYCLDNTGNLRVVNSTLSGGTTMIFPSFFLVNAGALVVKNTAFSDNRFGAAVDNQGTADIDASSFVNLNSEGMSSGGAILNSGTLAVTRTQFSNNTSGFCPAIASSGILAVKDSTFENNRASFRGGALCLSGQVTIEGSRFVGNYSGGHSTGGGAIFNWGALTVRSTDFSDNFASGTGGGIHNAAGATLTIKSSTFSGNSATYGGAIANGGSAVYFTDHNFDGGAIRIGNSFIFRNTASELGGGIYNYGIGTVQLDRDTVVTDNTPDDVFP